MSSIHAAQNAAKTRVRVGATIAAALAVALTSLVAGGAPASANNFYDVPGDHQFRTEISWLADQKITTGYADGSFKPRDSVSREAFAAFLYRLEGQPSPNLPSTSPFKDVSTSAKFYKEIVWLSNSKITTGWADGTFRPKDKISREAIAAFLYRFDDKPSHSSPSRSPFTDMTTSSKFFKEVTWLADQKITTGYKDGTFRPKANVSREAIAAFLYRGHGTVLDADALPADARIPANGTYKVGDDFPAGIYTATVADADGRHCYWERRDTERSTSETGIDGVNSIGITDEGRAIAGIRESDNYFVSRGCTDWTPLAKTSPNATSFGDGTHAAGYHMKPGTYRAPGGDGCYWETSTRFSSSLLDIIKNQFVDGKPDDVRVSAGQGIESKRCGTWERIGN